MEIRLVITLVIQNSGSELSLLRHIWFLTTVLPTYFLGNKKILTLPFLFSRQCKIYSFSCHEACAM